MNNEEFRIWAHRLVDWMADFHQDIENLPVKSQVKPGEIIGQIPATPPIQGEGMDRIFDDFKSVILPGMTHWQHPNFHAYFPANGSYPSLLAEMLTATLGAQCMIWQTSPAAAELEQQMMYWLRDLCGLPKDWEGCIQATASESTLCALLTAREKATDFQANQLGLQNLPTFRIYASSETHSSIEKAVRIAGFGSENLVKVEVDDAFAMDPNALEAAIRTDQENGFYPLCVVATLGTTGSTAMDPVKPLGEIARKYNLWYHVDAAFAGTALALTECRHWGEGLELADSYVFNPHKWMFTHFDCSAYFVKDPEALIHTFEILPEYLKTPERTVNNYRDWGIPLGRRFRALKLWFVLRSFGVDGIRNRLRKHLDLARKFEQWVANHPDFELTAPSPLNLVCFRWMPTGISDAGQLNTHNERLLQALNETGEVFFSHTKLDGIYTLRMVIGQTSVEERHVLKAWELITKTAQKMAPNSSQ